MEEEPKTRFAHQNPDGSIDVIDMFTGEKVGENTHLLAAPNLELTWQFSWIMADIICQKIREGKTLTEVCKLPGMPHVSIVHQWKRMDLDFAGSLKDALKDRGEYHRDKVLEIAANAKDRNGETDYKLQIDVHKWAAEKDDPEKFGNRTKLVGDPDKPIAFIIDTGIRRSEPPGDEPENVVNEPKELEEPRESSILGSNPPNKEKKE